MPEADEQPAGLAPDPKRFREVFGVGGDDAQVHPADAVGVPLAAIQALYELVKQQEQSIADLRARIELAERRPGPPPS